MRLGADSNDFDDDACEKPESRDESPSHTSTAPSNSGTPSAGMGCMFPADISKIPLISGGGRGVKLPCSLIDSAAAGLIGGVVNTSWRRVQVVCERLACLRP